LYIVRRTQIYLDEDQDRRLTERAAAERQTKSRVIRQAIDCYLSQPLDDESKLAEFRAAVAAAAGAEPDLTEDYLDGLREADRRRSRELDRRWHGRSSNQAQ
jgi:predicted transcriptional regulator